MVDCSATFLNELGLGGYQQITPKPQWTSKLKQSMDMIHELPEKLHCLQTLFQEELQQIVWLEVCNNEAPALASAAYPEVPGVVFLTPAVFVYVPPQTIVTPKNFYCAFENMVHECLHHRGEKIIKRSAVLVEAMKSTNEITVSWRNTAWSFSHAIQAYYIYLWIYELRSWRHQCVAEALAIRESLASTLPELRSILQELEGQLCKIAGISSDELRENLLIDVGN